MRDLLIAAAFTAAALTGAGAASAQDPAETYFSLSNTGRGMPFFYHQVRGDCGTLSHIFGRNGAWGLWTLPLDAVSQGTVIADGEHALVRFDCVDGSACIGKGLWRETNEQIATHDIPFATPALAESFLTASRAFRSGCPAA